MRNLIKGQTAFVSGASSGIGKACAEQLAAHGVNLVITARRLDRLENISKELSEKYSIKCHTFQLDVRNFEDVQNLFNKLSHQNIEIDILVNNAGLALALDKLQDGKIEDWNIMIDTNVKGLLFVTKAFLPAMIIRNKGHIVNIGSVAGHDCYAAGNVYCATKHAVKAISKSLRIDLLGTALRVSEIDPGAVETEFSIVRRKDEALAKKVYEGYEPLVADDIADAVLYCLTRPLHVNVSEMIVHPQAQASITDIFRNKAH